MVRPFLSKTACCWVIKDIEDITRWREDMNVMFEWHENIKFISSNQRVMFFLLYGDKISEIAHFILSKF